MKLVNIIVVFVFLSAFTFNVLAQDTKVDPLVLKEIFEELPEEKTVENLKLGERSPNELEGYEFFKTGKLKELKLGISTRENVRETLGKDCEDICEYSDDWRIVFTYFDHISREISEDGKTTKYLPDPKFANTIYSIKFVPKKRISFSNITFSDQFRKFGATAFGHDFSGKAVHVAFFSYTDPYGLRYVIFDKITLNTANKKDESQTGDLMSIEYTIPRQLEEKMFVIAK